MCGIKKNEPTRGKNLGLRSFDYSKSYRKYLDFNSEVAILGNRRIAKPREAESPTQYCQSPTQKHCDAFDQTKLSKELILKLLGFPIFFLLFGNEGK